MPAAPAPPNEALRLSALRGTWILDTPRDPLFDDIAREAAQIAVTPIALISFISDKTQWIKASVGLDLKETSRNSAFCAWAIHNAGVTWVEDAVEDKRFSDNPLVHGDPYIRHYAGAPISTPKGYLLGTICVLDRVPRAYDTEVGDQLLRLSSHVSQALERRKAMENARRSPAEPAE